MQTPEFVELIKSRQDLIEMQAPSSNGRLKIAT